MFIVHATLLSIDGAFSNEGPLEGLPTPTRLAGTTITSLTHVRNPLPGKFLFIFNDLSIRQEGKYRLKFRMYEVVSDECEVRFRAETISSIITAYSPKNFPGLGTSSDLIKEIAQQGHKVRVRKESTLNKRRKRVHLVSKSSSLSMSSSTSNADDLEYNEIEDKGKYYGGAPWGELPIQSDLSKSSIQAHSLIQTSSKSPVTLSNPDAYSEHNSPINLYGVRDPYSTQLQTAQIPNGTLDMSRNKQVMNTQNISQEPYHNMIQVSLIPMVPSEGNQNIPQHQPVPQPNINAGAYIYLNNPQPSHPYIQ